MKTGPFKIQMFCPNFKWSIMQWQLFVRILNYWASRFQIPFEIRTICNPSSFWPFKIQTIRSPLYLNTELVRFLNAYCKLIHAKSIQDECFCFRCSFVDLPSLPSRFLELVKKREYLSGLTMKTFLW